jgi:hypothetical protein
MSVVPNSVYSRNTTDGFYMPTQREVALLPLKFEVYFNQRNINISYAFIQGLINHSEKVRSQLKSAIQALDKSFALIFTSSDIESSSWLWFLSGSRSMKPHELVKIDLCWFIAFSHSYMATEQLLMEIINFHFLADNPSIPEAIFYCITVLGWHNLARNFLEVSLDFRHLPIPLTALAKLNKFKTFIRSALRSRERYCTANRFHDPYTGMAKPCPSHKLCLMCSTLGIENKIADQINLYSHMYNIHVCPSHACTTSFPHSINLSLKIRDHFSLY